MKLTKVTISPDGRKVTVEPQGYPGEQCRSKTAPLEKALGIVTDDQPTAELHQMQEDTQLDQLGQG